MGKYTYKDLSTNREMPEELTSAEETFLEAAERVRKNGEGIAKAIGGHIPERVLDDGLLKRR